MAPSMVTPFFTGAINGLLPNRITEIRGELPPNINLQESIAPNIWPITADRRQIEHIVYDLVNQIQDWIPESGTLTLEAGNLSRDLDEAQPDVDLPPGDYVSLKIGHKGASAAWHHITGSKSLSRSS